LQGLSLIENPSISFTDNGGSRIEVHKIRGFKRAGSVEGTRTNVKQISRTMRPARIATRFMTADGNTCGTTPDGFACLG